MKIITICGSMKFKKEIMEKTRELALNGNCILTPIYPTKENETLTQEQKENLIKEHFKKIELSDAILVLNKNNYIGKCTKLEIEYAKSLNKEILFYE